MQDLKLRPYQNECVDAILESYNQGISKQLVILPTGSGKTVIMTALAKQFGKRTLVLAHTEELIGQAVNKFKMFWSGVDVGVCKAEKNEVSCQVVVGSMQSCCKQGRLEQLRQQNFELLIVDEAHRIISDSYQAIINDLGFNESKEKLLLGMTATGNREGLGNTFDKITFSRSISTMIKAGYLCPIRGRKVLTNITLNKIGTQNGDFIIDELSEAVNTPERNAFIAEKYKQYATGRKGIAFCADVKHCQDLADAFKAVGIESKAVFGALHKDERESALQCFKTGSISVLTSCGILCEGYDEESVSAVAMCRPTKSQGLYVQCIGRGLRLSVQHNKKDCLVLDFTDQGHNITSLMSLRKYMPELESNEYDGENEEKEIEEKDHTKKITIFDEKDEEFDLLGVANFIWTDIGDSEFSLADDERNEIVLYPTADGLYTATLYTYDHQVLNIVKNPLPLSYCSGTCEDFARQNLKLKFAIKAPWMTKNELPTQGQKDFLLKNKIPTNGLTKAEASILIKKIIALRNKKYRKQKVA